MEALFNERLAYGEAAEEVIKAWMDKNDVNYIDVRDQHLTYDFKIKDTADQWQNVDVKRGYDNTLNTIKFKIGNGKSQLNAGVFYFKNQATTYLFVDKDNLHQGYQISTNTLK